MNNNTKGKLTICLFVIVLVLYYPVIYAPLNPMDDRAIVSWLYNMDGVNLRDVLFRTTDYYYRPVLLFSYIVDKILWGAETSFMHLENVILHASNVVLIFFIGSKAFPRMGAVNPWIPFYAALLYAIHPLNTESVNWIAGRSDLLACFFILLSCLSLFHGLDQNRYRFALIAFLCLIPGLFSKETAIFFIPAALVIMVSYPDEITHSPYNLMVNFKQRFGFILLFLLIPFFYAMFRIPVLLSKDSGSALISQFLFSNKPEWWAIIKTSLEGVGFYSKKLFFPWPLNFVITQVSDTYIWIGLIVVVFLCYLIFHLNLLGGFILSTAILGSSAIIVMILRPAWTPVAERYMYIPATFFCMGITVYSLKLIQKVYLKRVIRVLLMLFYALTAATSVNRNLIWQDNLLLFQDSVRKSPDAPFARAVLADLLIERGRTIEGQEIIRKNTAPAGLRNAEYLDLKRAQLFVSEGRYRDAQVLILNNRKKDGQLYYVFTKLLLMVDAEIIKDKNVTDKNQILSDMITANIELYDAYKDPFYYYRVGLLYLQLSDKSAAIKYLKLAQDGFSSDSYYKKAAEKLADKLSTQ